MIKKSQQEQIEINLKALDFDIIHKTLESLGVTWKDTNTNERRVPTKKEISVIARECMQKAFENDTTGIASMGGFEAEVINGVVEIKFVLTSANPLSKLLG